MLEPALALLGAMGAILLTWMLLALWLTAIGLSVARVALGSRLPFHSLATAPWLGLAALLEFLQLWHLLLPIGGLAFLVLAICGSVAVAFNADWFIQCIHDHCASWRLTALPFAIAVLWLANRAIGPCLQYDSAFYHLAGVRWANEFPIERGLGNLFTNFALNNSNLLLNAMMEFGPWQRRSSHVFNGFFAVLMVPVIVGGFRSLLIHRGRRAAEGLFAVLTGVMVMKYAVTFDLASPSTDMPAALFGLLGAWRVFRMLERLPRSAREWDCELVLATAVLSAAVTLKVSAIFFVTIAWFIAVAAWMRWRRVDDGPRSGSIETSTARLRPLAGALLISTTLIGTWIIRGYLLSGFPLFPSAVGGVRVDWRVSETARSNTISALQRFNKTTYRNRAADVSGFHWVPVWFLDTFLVRSGAEGVLPACIAIGAVIFELRPRRKRFHTPDAGSKVRRRAGQNVEGSGSAAYPRTGVINEHSCYETDVRRKVRSARNAGWILIVPATIALIFWFMNAPTPRMGAMPFWIIAATAASMATLAHPTRRLKGSRKSIVCGCVVVIMFPLFHIAALIQFRYRHDPNMAYYNTPAWRILPFYGPGPDHGFYPLRSSELIEVHTDSGLSVYMPKPPGQDLWYAPLPGTPDLNPKLRLRKPGSMNAGFTVQP